MHRRTMTFALLAAAWLAACQNDAAGPVAVSLDAPRMAKNKGPTLVADVVADPAFISVDRQLASTCPGETGPDYVVLFKHSGCLIVQPTGAAYALTDDIVLGTQLSKPPNRVILGMRLRGQDVIGEAGIMHETDFWSYDPPITPNPAGFVIHAHRDQVPVWRLSGHLRGERVAMIGTIAIGDIVYRPAP